MKTHNPNADEPRQPWKHLWTQPCGRKRGSPGLRGAVAVVHAGAEAAADRMCPSPRRKLKCCLTSSRSEINQSAPLMIDHVFQSQRLPVKLFQDNGGATVKQRFGKLTKPRGRPTDSVLFSNIFEIIAAKKAIASLQCGQGPTIWVTWPRLLCLIRVDLILSIIYSVFTLPAGLLHPTY